MPNIELQSGEFLLFEKKVKSEASIVLNYIAGITVLIIISILLYLGSSITFDDWMAMIIISTVILVLVFGF
ncbi:MAG: hypothetical protein ACPG5P_05310, partial [Saprospiraceae bacterium]